jgi:hypothetical protein
MVLNSYLLPAFRIFIIGTGPASLARVLIHLRHHFEFLFILYIVLVIYDPLVVFVCVGTVVFFDA